jgi:hypothetical protein
MWQQTASTNTDSTILAELSKKQLQPVKNVFEESGARIFQKSLITVRLK